MDEAQMTDSETNQSLPTTSESGPAGGAANAPGGNAGGNKRDPISASPTIGSGVAGRDTDGNSTVTSDEE